MFKEVIEKGVTEAYWRGCTSTIEQLLNIAAAQPDKALTHEQLLLFRDRLRDAVPQ